MIVLYVEDNLNDIDLLRREFMRTRKDVVLETVPTIEKAKNIINNMEAIDLVIIDMKLPDGNGLDLLSHIRRHDIPTPVIIMTGVGDEDAAVNSLKAGADGYVPKKAEYYTGVYEAMEKAIAHYSLKEKQISKIKAMYIEHTEEDIVLTKRHFNRYVPNIKIEYFNFAGPGFAKIIRSKALLDGFDVVLLDYRMPGIDVSETIKAIVETSDYELPVIIVTGQGNEEIAAQVFLLGAVDYIIKNPGYLFKLPIVIQSAYEKVQLLKQKKMLKEKNEELDNFFNKTLDMLCITDIEGNFIKINSEWTSSLGFEAKEIFRRNIMHFIHDDDKSKVYEAVEKMKKTGLILNLETRYLKKDGKYIWLEWHCHKTGDKVYSSARDISRRVNAEQGRRESNEYFTKLLKYSNVPIVIWNADMEITFFNKAFERILGYGAQEIFSDGFKIISKMKNKKELINYVRQASKGKVLKNVEVGINTKDGNKKWILWNTSNIKDQDNETIIATIAQGVDITKRKISQERNEYLNIHDQLTGLYNRTYYQRKIEELSDARYLPLTVVFADINGLKIANDAFGYSTGDKLLCLAADILKSQFREEDIIVRMGGDEFIVLMPNADKKYAEVVVDKIREDLVKVKVETIQLSLSFGIETKKTGEDIFSDVIKKAENHMHRLKLYEGPSIRGKTLYAILNTLHEKNKREELHSRRVSRLCEEMGCILNMPENDINDLITVGLLHDIGKVAVNDSILNKKDPLTRDEWEKMKQHPEIGFRIVSEVNDVADLAESILYHHERWDGKGYPRGLKGKEIPVMSRVIAVADAYDAMTSNRPYRNKISDQDARKEIFANAGKQFDPEIVRAFMKIEMHK